MLPKNRTDAESGGNYMEENICTQLSQQVESSIR